MPAHDLCCAVQPLVPDAPHLLRGKEAGAGPEDFGILLGQRDRFFFVCLVVVRGPGIVLVVRVAASNAIADADAAIQF